MHKGEEESSEDIILLHCSKARLLWQQVFLLFGVVRVLQALVKETLLSSKGRFVRKKRKKAWESCSFMLVLDYLEKDK